MVNPAYGGTLPAELFGELVRITPDTVFLDFLFLCHSRRASGMFLAPHDVPRPLKPLGCLATMMIWVIVLAHSAVEVIGGTTIIAPGGFTLENVCAAGHREGACSDDRE